MSKAITDVLSKRKKIKTNWFCAHRNLFLVFRNSNSNVQTLSFYILSPILEMFQHQAVHVHLETKPAAQAGMISESTRLTAATLKAQEPYPSSCAFTNPVHDKVLKIHPAIISARKGGHKPSDMDTLNPRGSINSIQFFSTLFQSLCKYSLPSNETRAVKPQNLIKKCWLLAPLQTIENLSDSEIAYYFSLLNTV